MRRLMAAMSVVLAVAATATVGAVTVAVTDASPAHAQGCAPRLAVSKTTGLAAAGETVTVSGSCFDVTKGVYVAFCVVPPAGSVPTPCGGGVDMGGANGLSHWISSNPPPQGVGLTTPYGAGGTFTVTMRPSSQLNASVECRRVSCAIVTRNDHTRSSDRSQDVVVPVTFAPDPAPATVVPAIPALPSFPVVPAPAEVPTTLPAEQATTTTPTEVAPATSTTTLEVDPAPGAEEVVLDAASSSTDGGSGALAPVLVGLSAVLVAVAGGAWWAVRRRSPATDGSVG